MPLIGGPYFRSRRMNIAAAVCVLRHILPIERFPSPSVVEPVTLRHSVCGRFSGDIVIVTWRVLKGSSGVGRRRHRDGVAMNAAVNAAVNAATSATMNDMAGHDGRCGRAAIAARCRGCPGSQFTGRTGRRA